MAKKIQESMFVCGNCGNEFNKWAGQCPACHEWNSLKEISVNTIRGPKANPSVKTNRNVETKTVAGLTGQKSKMRIPTGVGELDNVLGGGLVTGGVVLFAGEPGIGKSTLLTQVISKLGGLYVAGEESGEQIGLRIDRLGLGANFEILESNNVDELSAYLERTQNLPKMIVVDSIQVMMCADVTGGAGSPTQIRECCFRLIQMAKSKGVAMVIVGHVTKEGDIAGPKLLEHMVDVVLYFEGDKTSELRLLRAYKNRFGPTDEVGLFKMEGKGLVESSSNVITDANLGSPGSALCVVMDGTRSMLVEIQALVVESFAPQPRRVFAGIDNNRGQLLIAIAQKHLHIPMYKYDVFVQVTGGLKITDPAADLAVLVALHSSYKETPANGVYIGEVGLLGKVKRASNFEKRQKQASGLGKVVREVSGVAELLRR